MMVKPTVNELLEKAEKSICFSNSNFKKRQDNYQWEQNR